MISVIIPVLNEEANLIRLSPFFEHCANNTNIEIIVIDGGSSDKSLELANSYGLRNFIAPKKGRAAQMNYGAKLAHGEILYFVHADTMPHADFFIQIINALNNGIDFGCYKYQFDSPSKLLQCNAYMTKFKGSWVGGGDQTLFISKANFNKLNGFNDDYLIMEDFDFVKRAKKMGLIFGILPFNIIVSARKYNSNSWLRVQLANATIITAWKIGASQKWMKENYQKWLK
jgi:rSAM/selenodomain-associated transferase 2